MRLRPCLFGDHNFDEDTKERSKTTNQDTLLRLKRLIAALKIKKKEYSHQIDVICATDFVCERERE